MSRDQPLRLAKWMKPISTHPPAGEGGEADHLPQPKSDILDNSIYFYKYSYAFIYKMYLLELINYSS